MRTRPWRNPAYDPFTVREHPPIPPKQALPVALYAKADPGFFTALEIPLLSGRFFTNDDRAGHPETATVSANWCSSIFQERTRWAVRLIQSMLYETKPLDPAIFVPVATALLAVAALACLIPARIDPNAGIAK